MHAGRYFFAASVLLAECVLAQDSGELHHNLKREEDWSFSPADIVKRQIPATGEKIVEPPAECVQACQGFIAFGVSCAQGKEASTLTDQELLTCACRADFLTALKSCATCAPQIFEGTDGSNAQTAVDDAAEQCTINGIAVPGFESTPNEDEYKCDPVDGEGDSGNAGGAVPGGNGGGSSKTSESPVAGTESAKPTGGDDTSPSKSPSADESSKSVAPGEEDNSAPAAGPTAAPGETDPYEEDDEDFDVGSSSEGVSSSSAGDDFGGDFGGASASIDSQRILLFGIAAVTAILACLL